MFNGHIGVGVLLLWIGGMIVIAAIDAFKEMLSCGRDALERANGRQIDIAVLPTWRNSPRRTDDHADELMSLLGDVVPTAKQ